MINLTHEIQEVELILKHLGQGAYAEVATLIEKIKAQAIPQVQAKANADYQKAQNANMPIDVAAPQVQDAVNQAEANSDSMANE